MANQTVVKPAVSPAPAGFAGTQGEQAKPSFKPIESPIATGTTKPATSGTHPNQK